MDRNLLIKNQRVGSNNSLIRGMMISPSRPIHDAKAIKLARQILSNEIKTRGMKIGWYRHWLFRLINPVKFQQKNF